jgi:sarcosine oxidase, subunit alpha
LTRLPNRLPADTEHHLKGREIDRGRPLSFRLDGREIHGFAGDTLLSAALASGLVGVGLHEGQPLALDERFAPAVLPRNGLHGRLAALPMELTPAIDGLDLVTLAKANRNRCQRRIDRFAGLLPRARRSLGLRFADDQSLASPWFDAVPEHQIEADLAVVGGGYAGLSAALTAARRGEKVVLVERRQGLGGDARFFGSTGDEPPPDETIARLTTALGSLGNVTILLRAEAFAVFEGTVRINQVVVEDGMPAGRPLTLLAPRIVLANGSLERLPVFAGNRLPGVVGALAAFNRADRFGVWIGRHALLSTSTSVAYRVATQAKDAGIEMVRIADTRLNPQSRFIEFGKASGIPLARDLKPVRVAPAGGQGGLEIELAHILEGGARATEQFGVDQFLVCGGWQPDLSLWHMAGGGSRWNAERQQLEGEGTLPGIALAGAVAGYRNGQACIASGQAAVALLYGRSMPEIADAQIDPIYETPDAATAIGTFSPGTDGNAYLDGGASLALRPAPRQAGRRRPWPLRRRAPWGVAEQARPLGVGDVAAAVQLGEIPSTEAAIVAQERCITPGDIVDAGKLQPVRLPEAHTAATPPAYLAGRFGSRTSIWVVEAADGRAFETGCLVLPGLADTDPLAAIGVVFAPAPTGRTGGLAVVGKLPAADNAELAVKDVSGVVAVRLVDPLQPIEQPVVITPVRLTESTASPDTMPLPPQAVPPTPGAAIALIAGVGEVGPAPPQAEPPAASPDPAAADVSAAATTVEAEQPASELLPGNGSDEHAGVPVTEEEDVRAGMPALASGPSEPSDETSGEKTETSA